MTKFKKTTVDLSGMELQAPEERMLSKWRASNPNPTPRDIARREVLLSSMSDDAKLFAVAVIEFGGLSGPVPMSVRDAQIFLSKSKDGAQSAAKKFSEWPHSMVEKSERGGKYRYGIMENILLKSVLPHRTVGKKCPDLVDTFPEEVDAKVSCHTGQNDAKVSCHTGQFPIGRGDSQSGAKGGVVVFTETATPNEGDGSGKALTPTSTLPSPNPDISNPDITAREYIGVHESDEHNPVIVNCATIKGPGFVIDLRAAEMEAALMGMPAERGRMIAEREARSWATQGFVPGQPDKVVASAIRKHVPQMAEIKAQVAAVSEAPQAVKVWKDRMIASGKEQAAPAPTSVDLSRFDDTSRKPVRQPFGVWIGAELANEILDKAKATREEVIGALQVVENEMPAERAFNGRYAVTEQQIVNWCVMKITSDRGDEVNLELTEENIRKIVSVKEASAGWAIIELQDQAYVLLGKEGKAIIWNALRSYGKTVGYAPAAKKMHEDPIGFFDILKKRTRQYIQAEKEGGQNAQQS